MREIISFWVSPFKPFASKLLMVGSGMVFLVSPVWAQSDAREKPPHHHHHHHAHKEGGKGEDQKATSHKNASSHKKNVKSSSSQPDAAGTASSSVEKKPLPAPSSGGVTQTQQAAVQNIGAAAAPSAVVADSGIVLPAQQNSDVSKGTETGLPLPRFASLRADRVYMRRGPGERYPIDWVYYRRGLPVKIEREFAVWRLIEDSEGQKGWVHQVTLRGTRDFVVLGDSSLENGGTSQNEASLPLKEGAQSTPITHADSQIIGYISSKKLQGNFQHDALLMSSVLSNHNVVAVLKPGTVGVIKACPEGSTWCHVTVRGYDGWLERRALWGVQPGEIIQPD